MEQTSKIFAITVTIRARPTADQRWQLVNGGFANAVVLAPDEERAINVFRAGLARAHWDLDEIKQCLLTDPAVAESHAPLRELLAKARTYGVGIEVFPAVRGPDSDPLQ